MVHVWPLRGKTIKIRTRVLQITAVFPPILALVVGLSLFLRVRREDEAARTFRAAEAAVTQILELNHATRGFILHPEDDAALARWESGYDAMAVTLRELGADDRAKRDDFQRMISDYAHIRALFGQIRVGLGAGMASSGRAALAALEDQLQLRSQAIISGAFRVALSSHMNAVVAQQNTDAIIIIFSSILAVVMAVGAYMAVKEELLERERVGQALRQTDVRLSDAVIRLKRASEQAFQHERLHALEQAARSTVHESRNALTPILSSAEFLASPSEALRGKIRVEECAEMIERSGRRLAGAIDRLDRFLHVSIGGGPVNLNQVVEEALLSTRPSWKERPDSIRIHVKTELAIGLPSIAGDETDLCEATMNLILNAVDAMPQGGTLTLRTQADGGLAALEVSDTGVGMSEEVRRRGLEPFFSTKGAGQSGMGLTVVDSIVRRHGGTIDIESKPDAGTAVVICLPVRSPVPPKIGDGMDAMKKVSSLRVLVVDDESWSRLAVTKLLVTDGHVVETAASGFEGLDKFRDGVFDLVVTDRAMPDMSGEELAEAVKRHGEPRPVILVTGFADATDKGRKSAKCVDAVVDKPVKPEELRKAILSVVLHS